MNTLKAIFGLRIKICKAYLKLNYYNIILPGVWKEPIAQAANNNIIYQKFI